MNDYITGFLDGMKLTKYLAEKIVKDARGYRDFKKRLDREVNILQKNINEQQDEKLKTSLAIIK